MKYFVSLIFMNLVTGSIALAKVPYAQLEKLREESVVVRVILDSPDSKEAKLCKVDKAKIGSNLEMKIDAATDDWSKIVIGPEDIETLTYKMKICVSRGSYQIYDEFMGAAKAADSVKTKVTELKNALDESLSRMTAADYRKAWNSVDKPCDTLK